MRGDFACPRPNSLRISVWGQGHVGIDERRIKADGSARGQVDKGWVHQLLVRYG